MEILSVAFVKKRYFT